MPNPFLITGTGSYVLSSTLNWARPEVSTGLGNGGTLRLSDPTVIGSLPATRYYRLQRNP